MTASAARVNIRIYQKSSLTSHIPHHMMAFDVGSIQAAVAAGDMMTLQAACEWVKRDVSSRQDVARELQKVLDDAQAPAWAGASRQMTMDDVRIILALAPHWASYPSLPCLRLPSGQCVSHVLKIGLQTNCNVVAMIALADWCQQHEKKSFRGFIYDMLEFILIKPLVLEEARGTIGPDPRRCPDGSLDSIYHVSRRPLLPYKIKLRPLVFLLEHKYIFSDKDCPRLLEKKITSCMKEMQNLDPTTVNINTDADEIAEVSTLLKRSWVAVSCKWSLLRETWIRAVVMSGFFFA